MSGAHKRRASRSPSPARERARGPPPVLRRARSDAPSLADLPAELVELVVRCAAENMNALQLIRGTSRALDAVACSLMLAILTDHGLIQLHSGCWQAHYHGMRDFLAEDIWLPNACQDAQPSAVLWRGTPLSRCIEIHMRQQHFPFEHKVLLDAAWPDWRTANPAIAQNLFISWPTPMYRLRVQRLLDLYKRFVITDLPYWRPAHVDMDLLGFEKSYGVAMALRDHKHPVAHAWARAAVDHPTFFDNPRFTLLVHACLCHLLGGMPSIDHLADQIDAAAAALTAQSRLIGVPSAILKNKELELLFDAQSTLERPNDASIRVLSHYRQLVSKTNHLVRLQASMNALSDLLVRSERKDLLELFEQAAKVHAGQILLLDLREHMAASSWRLDVFAALLPHYVDCLRCCVAQRASAAL